MRKALYALFFFAVLSSCKKEESAYCSKNIDLGEFTANIEMPYDTFRYVELISENAGNEGISINHPNVIDGPEMFYHRQASHTYSSDCEGLGVIEKYSWTIMEQQEVVLLTVPGTPIFLIKALPGIDSSKPEIGPVAEYIQFFEKGPGGSIEQDDFMSVMVSETIAGEGAKWEKGYHIIDTLEIAGQTFTQVITNNGELKNGIKDIYFTMGQGVVGIKDNQDVLWRINE